LKGSPTSFLSQIVIFRFEISFAVTFFSFPGVKFTLQALQILFRAQNLLFHQQSDVSVIANDFSVTFFRCVSIFFIHVTESAATTLFPVDGASRALLKLHRNQSRDGGMDGDMGTDSQFRNLCDESIDRAVQFCSARDIMIG
jgi:hypothetical protein